jgi:hypothetical protein
VRDPDENIEIESQHGTSTRVKVDVDTPKIMTPVLSERLSAARTAT